MRSIRKRRRGPLDTDELPFSIPFMIRAWMESSHSLLPFKYLHPIDRDHGYMFPLYHFPELPFSKSLLIKGDYHPSAPIHFCISHLSRANAEGTAVFITSSRDSFVQTLVAHNDRWLGKYGGSGEVATKLSRVKVLFVANFFRYDLLVGYLSREIRLATPRLFVSWPCCCRCCTVLPQRLQRLTQDSC